MAGTRGMSQAALHLSPLLSLSQSPPSSPQGWEKGLALCCRYYHDNIITFGEPWCVSAVG